MGTVLTHRLLLESALREGMGGQTMREFCPGAAETGSSCLAAEACSLGEAETLKCTQALQLLQAHVCIMCV